ncbi:membrane protein [Spirochaetia bacterium]|nr:membrane protein [Spirochaetia bacterium]
MKHTGFKVFWLVLLASMAVASVFADENTVNIEARSLDSFDGESAYQWQVVASKFASTIDGESFPKLSYVAAWPTAAFRRIPEGRDLKSLGIWGKFDRRGYNWIDIYPTSGGGDVAAPAEIPIPGRAQTLDLWVWGSNLNYTLEAYVRDHLGVVHIIPLGNLHHTGWKNLRATIPTAIPQSQRALPRLAGLRFVKFRVWTLPTERVDNFYIYFDEFKVLTDTFESFYDGEELASPEKIEEFWADSSNANSAN